MENRNGKCSQEHEGEKGKVPNLFGSNNRNSESEPEWSQFEFPHRLPIKQGHMLRVINRRIHSSTSPPPL